MKKKALALLLTLLLVFLCACGSSASQSSYYAGSANTEAYAPAEAPAAVSADKSAVGDNGGSGSDAPAADPIADKIIYSAQANVETRDFDASLKAVDALIARVGGFLESSSITGSDYQSGRDYRSADYVIRIPADAFSGAMDSLSDLGNVTYRNTQADNITTQYYDTQSRLDAYQVEYDRLMDMLAKAETVEDMLSIEDRLSDVRYNIESLTTTMKSWDSQVNYSTLSLSLTEVKDYTNAQGAGLTYWQEVGQALQNTLEGVGRFFKGLLRFLIAALPVLLILAAVAAVVLLLIRRRRARRARAAAPAPAPQKTDENTQPHD